MNSNIIVDLKNVEQKDFAFLQIAYDLDMIIELLNRLKSNSIISVEILPFISLFCFKTIDYIHIIMLGKV